MLAIAISLGVGAGRVGGVSIAPPVGDQLLIDGQQLLIDGFPIIF